MAGTDHLQPVLAGGPAIVLVEPQLGQNIGMAARAMANFGLDDLRLVNPRDGWPNPEAEAAASGANHVIEKARVSATLEEAIGDLSFVVASTARRRDGFKPVIGPERAAAELRRKSGREDTPGSGQGTGILFGRERFGLSNEEIALADYIVTFPVNPAFASLNIAQSVLLMGYEWMRSSSAGADPLPFAGPEHLPADKSELLGLFAQLENALRIRGYFRPAAKTAAMVDDLRAVLTRPAFNAQEIRVLRGVVSSLDRFSPRQPKGSGPPSYDRPRSGTGKTTAKP